ncbi:hypothetical protein DRJ72_14470, partial [Enterococcus faecalis]
MEEYSCPLIQEPHDPNHIIQEEQESEVRLKETVDQFHATLHQLEQAINQLSSRRLNIQGTPMVLCGESNDERSMKETLETPEGSNEHNFVLEQL